MNMIGKLGILAVAAVVGVKAADMAFNTPVDSSPEAILEQKVTREAPVTSDPVLAEADTPTTAEVGSEQGEGTEVISAAAAPAAQPQNQLPEILAGLQAERKDLAAREAVLAEEKAAIALARAAMEQEAGQLTALRETIAGLLTKAEENHNADVARLVSIYTNMKAGQAAGILNDADLEMTVMVLAKMPERTAGPILAEMEEKKARLITKIIHERSRLPGDQRF